METQELCLSQTYHVISLICRILKKDTNEFIYKTERLTDIENAMVTKGESGRRDKLGVWDQHICTTIYKLVVKEPACQCRRHKRHRFNPWVGKIP